MKRPCQTPSALDCQSLGSSLKRVRISTTPGELRLDRDLQQLIDARYGWTQVNDRRWMLLSSSVLLERTNDPLRLLITFPQHYQVWIQLPRLYPHAPPVVARIVHPTLQRIVVALVPPVAIMEGPLDVSETNTLVYNEWSPIRQLGDLLEFLVSRISSCHSRLTNGQGESTSSMDGDWLDDVQMSSTYNDVAVPSKLQSTFPPNRFDMGYPRSAVGCGNTNSMMEY